MFFISDVINLVVFNAAAVAILDAVAVRARSARFVDSSEINILSGEMWKRTG